MFDMVLLVLGMAGLAVTMLLLAWVALGEYKKVFQANPRLVMSVEVFAVLTEIGGPGYLAAVLGFCGLWLLMIASVLLLFLVFSLFR
jgi:steroid 5-alpha reductase family enzyme